LTEGNAILDSVIYQVYLFIIIYLYYAWFWKKYNQTLGMKIWKVKIYSRYSLEVTYIQSIKRIIFALLGGHLLLLFKSESLQDIISNTYLEKVN
jgi:uncharacterized RDD family membrane protein YckC